MKIYDVTLRDGCHAIKHQLTKTQIIEYCTRVDDCGVDFVEVGHGIGQGASSLLIGKSLLSDAEMLKTARAHLRKSKLSIHIVPGYGTVDNIKEAIDCGVNTFRVATHCSESDTAAKHINFLRGINAEVVSGLMMSHMISPEDLLVQAKKMEGYGSTAVTILDSAGKFIPRDVTRVMELFKENLQIPFGFHAHNNLGFSVINSLLAYEAGASIIDASIIGFGAGAGNVPLELLVSAMDAHGYKHSCDLYKILDLADYAEGLFGYRPFVSPDSIISGLTGVVSVFSKHVKAAAKDFKVDSKDIYLELGRRKAIAGQEDMIIEIAQPLANEKSEDDF